MKQLRWKSVLTDNLPLASVSKSSNSEVLIAFYNDRLSGLLPNWNIRVGGQTIKKEFNTFWKLVSDTLLEYQPVINLGYYQDPGAGSCFNLKGRLVGFLFSSDDVAVKDDKGKYFLHLNIRLDGPQCLPSQISNITMTIRSKQLPYEKYSYQYCNRSANNLPCNFFQYLKATGTHKGNKGVGKENCRVFILSEGNPHQYCSIVVGT